MRPFPAEKLEPGTVDWPPAAVDAVDELRTTVEELREQTGQLEHALRSRVAIEQAKGVLAERYALAPDTAFALLRQAARSSRTRLHDLAREVVDSPSTPEPVARELARRQEARR